MADASLSLDEIIKKRSVKPGSKLNRQGQINGRVSTETSGRFTRPGSKTFNSNRTVASDARNKIIQNKRMKIRDARERLAEIAKQGDARDKINKIRKLNNSGPNQIMKKPVPPNRKNNVPLQKTVRNENRVSSLDGKTHMQGASLLRTVSGNKPPGNKLNAGLTKGTPFQPKAQAPHPGRMGPGVRVGLGQQRPILIPQRTQTLANNPNVFTIKNDRAKPVLRGGDIARRPARVVPLHMRRSPSPPPPNPARYTGFPLMDLYGTLRASSGMRSDRMDDVRLADRIRGGHMEDTRLGRVERLRARSLMEEEVRPTRLKITTVNTHKNIGSRYNEDEWDQPPPPLPKVLARKRPAYDDSISTVPAKKTGVPLSSELIARLDQPQRTGPSPGYKVVVSNLHHVVSVEDIEELFGNIGALKAARLVREGFAEVVFMNQEDALKSVEVYHNRQLDGQPMSVTLVTKKAAPALVAPLPTSTSTTKSILKSARGRSGYYL